MAVRLIALDIDGTLLDSRWDVSQANRSAIAEATRRGIEVALVTGRRYDFAMPVARQIASPLIMIVSNGAIIRTQTGETHMRHLLPRRTAAEVLRLTQRWRPSAGIIFDRPRIRSWSNRLTSKTPIARPTTSVTANRSAKPNRSRAA